MIDGYVHPQFAALAARFDAMYGKARQGGGAIAAYQDGELVLDVWTGWADARARKPWTRDTMAMSFSTTKGVISTLVHQLVEDGLIAYDEPIATYWPEFAVAGKQDITLRHLMTHTAGLHDVRTRVTHIDELLDHRAMGDLIARQEALGEPGRAPGYHGMTYGWLIAGLIERVTGEDVRDVLRTRLAAPLGVDGMYFGAPSDQRHRVATLGPRMTPAGLPMERLARRAEKIQRTRPFAEALLVDGFENLVMSGDPRLLDTAMPAANGVFTARSLAKLYGALANAGEVDGIRILRAETVEEIGRVQRRERDYVLGIAMRWRLGYHQAFVAGKMQPKAFGHFGFGGSGAWADPETGMALAFVTNRLGTATTPVGDARLARLGSAALKLSRAA